MDKCEQHTNEIKDLSQRVTALEKWREFVRGATTAINGARALMFAAFTASLSAASVLLTLYMK